MVAPEVLYCGCVQGLKHSDGRVHTMLRRVAPSFRGKRCKQEPLRHESGPLPKVVPSIVVHRVLLPSPAQHCSVLGERPAQLFRPIHARRRVRVAPARPSPQAMLPHIRNLVKLAQHQSSHKQLLYEPCRSVTRALRHAQRRLATIPTAVIGRPCEQEAQLQSLLLGQRRRRRQRSGYVNDFLRSVAADGNTPLRIVPCIDQARSIGV